MYGSKTISVVFPVYNEEQGIGQAIENFFNTPWVDEIVVVDNNSTDRSAEIVKATRARLVTEPNQGYGFALRRGMREASGDLIILAEPDGTFIAKDILKLLAYSDDFDMVLGTRTTRELIWMEANMGAFLRIGNWVVAKLLEVLFNGPSLSDCGCTLRLIRAESARQMLDRLTVGQSHFLPEMVILGLLNKMRIIEVPVNYRGRVGLSKITGTFKTAWRVGWRMIGLILGYRLRAWLGRVPALSSHNLPAPNTK
jgi:glycosyltransferase involved in cell wall biosynthesis